MYELLSRASDTVGLIGVILILIVYYLLSVNKMSSQSMGYQFTNFIGAWMILFSLYFHWNTASVTIEVAWIIISVIGMYRALSARCEEKKNPENLISIKSAKNN